MFNINARASRTRNRSVESHRMTCSFNLLDYSHRLVRTVKSCVFGGMVWDGLGLGAVRSRRHLAHAHRQGSKH